MPVILALWEAEVGVSPEIRSSRPAWQTWLNSISTKNTKISWVWSWEPVIPATWEAEAGESLEPGRWRFSELRSRHCTPACTTGAKLHHKKKKKKCELEHINGKSSHSRAPGCFLLPQNSTKDARFPWLSTFLFFLISHWSLNCSLQAQQNF